MPLTSAYTNQGARRLCPALGYSRNPIAMKVAKCAEYIPIVGSFVGVGHLAYALYKRVQGCEGSGLHVLRALVAITSCGAILAFFDIGAEIFRAHTAVFVQVDKLEEHSAEVVVTSEKAFLDFMIRLYNQTPSCCTSMDVLERGLKYRLVYRSGPDQNMRAFFHRLQVPV
jgi:hypothetical protein